MKSALIVGASRGIGRQIAITFSQNGYRVCVAAKTVQSTMKTPGSIYDVVDEIKVKGGDAIPMKCDVRNEEDINRTVEACVNQFGVLDVAVYNAGAIMWKPVMETPLRRYDLMNSINARGAYCLVQKVLPHMLDRRRGCIILVAPPIYSRFFKGKTPYSMTKAAMTVLTHGLASELDGTGVSVTALWPAKPIESHVTVVGNIPLASLRKPTIFADACLNIAEDTTENINGKALIDEDYLRTVGITDFAKYRCDESKEPARMMPKEFPSLKVAEENEQPKG